MNADTPSHGRSYIKNVIAAYLRLPDTPNRANTNDRRFAAELFRRRVPCLLVEKALLVASARRLTRSVTSTPLAPIRSLAYFSSAIEEIQSRPVDDSYLRYVRGKINRESNGDKATQRPTRQLKSSASTRTRRLAPKQLLLPF